VLVFLDFEASGLGRQSFPIEVGWVFEDGREEGHLIRPAPGWEEWDPDAERVHGIPRDRLEREGTPHDAVARRMVEVLTGHDLLASAPSWDGGWLSRLLRAAGLPRHALRLRDTEEARHNAILEALRNAGRDPARHAALAIEVLHALEREHEATAPVHRAVDDARHERALWQRAALLAGEAIARLP